MKDRTNTLSKSCKYQQLSKYWDSWLWLSKVDSFLVAVKNKSITRGVENCQSTHSVLYYYYQIFVNYIHVGSW